MPSLPGYAGPGMGGPFGQVPYVPSPTGSAATAISGGLQNLPDLEQLAGLINQFNTGAAVNPYVANLPNYKAMTEASSGNILDLLHGRIPTDVMDMLGQRAAERGVAIGSPGSPNANAAFERALGLTSLGLEQQGEGELTAAIGRTPVPPMFNLQQFLTTPEQEQAAEYAANVNKAAPDPAKQAQLLMDLLNRGIGQGGPRPGGGPVSIAPGGFGGSTRAYVPGSPDFAGGGGNAPGSYTIGTKTSPFGQFGPPTSVTDPNFYGGPQAGNPFGGAPSDQDWQGFLDALQTPGAPSDQDWQGFMNALNPSAPTEEDWGGFLDALNQPWDALPGEITAQQPVDDFSWLLPGEEP